MIVLSDVWRSIILILQTALANALSILKSEAESDRWLSV